MIEKNNNQAFPLKWKKNFQFYIVSLKNKFNILHPKSYINGIKFSV